jgi:hypothetical protein
MKLRLFTSFLAVALLAGCPSLQKKKDKYHTDKPPIPTKDQSNDVTFQGFVGQLKIAVAKHDAAMLTSLMAPGFGYRWDEAPAGETPFDYWDKNNLWGELSALLNERWVPYDGYMVVPMQLSLDQEYRGYRAGVQQVNGSWRFSYFVPAPPQQPQPPQPTQ